MRRTLMPMLALFLPLSGCAELQDILQSDLVSGVYFVKLNANPTEVVSLTNTILDGFGLKAIHIYDSASEGFTVRLPHDLVDEIEKIDVVDYVAEDPKQTFTPPEEDAETITLGPDEVPDGIARIGGPYELSIDFSDVHVAVIDTGVQANHPDLNVVAEADLVCDSTGDCADGTDPQGHGTHVAGTIGAYADGSGVVGVAPGVPIHAVRVLGSDGSGYLSDILAGLEYVLDHPEIRVVNMSLGGPAGSGLDDDFAEALDRLEDAGVVVCIAAGNESQDTANVIPAGLDRGLVVSAYDASGGSDNGYAWFSNYGEEVDIAAPGVAITSTWPEAEYADLDGTSMATPHMAGAAAVYIALHPNASANDVYDAFVNNGEDGYLGQRGDHPEPLLDLAAAISR